MLWRPQKVYKVHGTLFLRKLYVRQYSWPPILGLVSAEGVDHGDHGTVLAEPLAAQPDTNNYYSQQLLRDIEDVEAKIQHDADAKINAIIHTSIQRPSGC